MNKKIMISFLLVLPLLFGSVYISRGAPEMQAQEPTVTTVTYAYDENAVGLPSLPDSPPYTHVAVHGTGWTAETKSLLASFKPYGWGTYVKAKAAGYQWVHLPVPLVTFLESRAQSISYVEFCAKSSNGSITKPVQMDLWAHNALFFSGAISWPANQAINCYGATFSPPVWKQDLGISVLLWFDNATNAITLYKGWVQVEDP